jgi:lysophospholipase L1-like esterase
VSPRTCRAAATALLATGLLAGCADAGNAAAPGIAVPVPSGTTQVVAVGDSITEADSADFDDGDFGTGSWAAYAGGQGVVVLGGWAHGGATTQDMVDGVTAEPPVSGAGPGVLVLMAGNNDVDAGVPFAVTADNLVAIAALVHADRVVLSAIAPDDDFADEVTDFNARLPALAEREGWQLVDPMAGVGDGRGRYLPGLSEDGVHPTASGAQRIGSALHPALAG